MKSKSTYPVTKPELVGILEAVNTINDRFRSGNAVPVEKASVPAPEWEAVRVAIIAAFPEVFDAAKQRSQTHVKDRIA